jgi:hypothetical protein
MTDARGHRHRPGWQIFVAAADCVTLLFHANCEDRRECVALATEARSHSQALLIWIKDPYGHSQSFD